MSVENPSLKYETTALAILGSVLGIAILMAPKANSSVKTPQPQKHQQKQGSVTRSIAMPHWFAYDIQRHAAWLPEAIKTDGLEAAYKKRLNKFPDDIQRVLQDANIPPWLIALVPMGDAPPFETIQQKMTRETQQQEIEKQIRFMAAPAGEMPANKYAARAQQLLMFAGAAQMPTPGAAGSGRGLGAEGCTAAMSHYILAQMRLEFPEFSRLDDRLFESQDSAEMARLFSKAQGTGLVRITPVPFTQLERENFKPGSFLIATKPGGTHVMGWTDVPRGWNWDHSDLMAIGNTGLAPFGHRLILAQEYVTAPGSGEGFYNSHGPITNRTKCGDLSDPGTNIYWCRKGSDFIFIEFLDPSTPGFGLASLSRATQNSSGDALAFNR